MDDVDFLLGDDFEGALAGWSRGDVEILSRQASFKQADIRWNVVNDQHASCQRPAAPRRNN